ncbi:TIGR00341 family protein [Anaerotardibacter muris]|uniref:TIGR00341 family protein n=1 Tax=Anaerotardibacter muris TaxID=2941505 RepID=UPI0020420C4E|nr:TIGR00341 family protein [Anaerotardibacter muris]
MDKTKNLLQKVLAGGPITDQHLAEAEASTYVTLEGSGKTYSAYFWNIVISSIIATAGIAMNSGAVLVGAMLISPVMTPIVGSALAAITGNRRATIRTLLMTAAGVLLGLLIAIPVAAFFPVPIDLTTNVQVTTRTAPGLLDLLVAVASGFIAALAFVRDDIPEAIPGVAIAVSLMPPLCVTGVAIADGDLMGAAGAFLLFLTNYFGIQVMCLVVFWAVGLSKKSRTKKSARERMGWYVSVLVGVIVIAIPLAMTSVDMAKANDHERKTHEIAQEWLAGSDYALKDVKLKNNELTVTIAGDGKEPDLAAFKEDLAKQNVEFNDIGVIILEEKHL